MLAGKRAIRVGDQILKEIALLLLEKIKDPRVRGATMTGIRLSNDLKVAKVYYSVMGGDERIGEVKKGLRSAKNFIKREIGLRMALRYVPELIFVYDPSLKAGSEMDMLFESLRGDEPQPITSSVGSDGGEG